MEDFLELFTTIMVAYIFVLLGVVHERIALTMVYLDIVLYSAGGIIGTMHHVYFSGEPAVHMALGAFFSAAEVIPLTILTFEAWSFVQLGAQQGAKSQRPFPHFWAVMFLSSVALDSHCFRLRAALSPVSSPGACVQCLFAEAGLHGIRYGPRD